MRSIRAGLLVLFSIIFLSSCDYYLVKDYKHQVGYIKASNKDDSKDFKLCFPEKLFPYYYGRYPASYSAGKKALRDYFYTRYHNEGFNHQSGYITIRFIINCEGKAGSYEVRQVGVDFKKKKFSKCIVEKLVELTQSLQYWKPLEFYGDRYDSFYHISFKIVNGEIQDILP
jgi:hypothetical protein